jgi:hypothetical protein
MGVDVDGLAYLLHQPMKYGCQARAQSPLTIIVSSRHTVQAGVAIDHPLVGEV